MLNAHLTALRQHLKKRTSLEYIQYNAHFTNWSMNIGTSTVSEHP